MEKFTHIRDLNQYKAWVLDMDGTLYHQMPMRWYMALRLISCCIIHPKKVQDILILRDYRRLRENRFDAESAQFNESQIGEIAQKYHVLPETISAIIHDWMVVKPLTVIGLFQRRKLLSFIKAYQRKGVQMIVYSDNPVGEKLKVLNFSPNYAFWSGDHLIRCMKPDARGLRNIIDFLQIKESDILYIGDRDDRDGLCAKDAGLDYLDVRNFINLLRRFD